MARGAQQPTRSDMQQTDRCFRFACLACAALAGLLMLGVFVQLGAHSAAAWQRFGLGFLCSAEWDPAQGIFGAAPAIVGTLLCAFVVKQ